VYYVDGGALIEAGNTGGSPLSLATDHTGDVYAADAARGAVVHLTADRTAEPVCSSVDGAALKGPTCLLFDSSGALYFCDSGPEGTTSLFSPRASVFVMRGQGDSRTVHAVVSDSLATATALALSPSESALYVAESAANRVLRFLQKQGVYHATCFHQLSGRSGISALVCDHSRGGLLYIARPEHPDFSDKGLITILAPDGSVMRDMEVPGADISSLALSLDASHLYYTDAASATVFRVRL